MELRHNIILSFVMHAIPIIAAVTFVANRDVSSRLTEKLFAVSLTEDTEMPKSLSPEREKTEGGSRKEKERVIPSVHALSVPPSVPGGETDALPSVEEGNVSAQSRAVGPSLSTGTVLTAVPDRGAMGKAKESAGPNSLSTSAIREAIDRAKAYPAFAKRRGQEGIVVVEFSINLKGLPENVKVTRSSGFSLLDTAAREAIIRAAPLPVAEGRYEVPITFMLKKE